METGTKSRPTKKNNISKEKGTITGTNPLGSIQGEGSLAPPLADPSKNPFEILSTPPEISEQTNKEIEQQKLPPVGENDIIEAGLPGAPIGSSSPPTYMDMIRKKPPENSSSSKDETFERPSKIIGIKFKKETR